MNQDSSISGLRRTSIGVLVLAVGMASSCDRPGETSTTKEPASSGVGTAT